MKQISLLLLLLVLACQSVLSAPSGINSVLITFSSVSEVKVGDQFTVDVLVEDVVDLAGWQMDLLFNSDILEFEQVEEGSFLKQGGGQTFW